MRASTYGRQSKASEKSIAEQLELGEHAKDDHGWQNAGDYQDGRSASRFGTKQRDEWTRLWADVVAERLDVLILWESSRGDRTATTWLAFLDDCRKHNVCIYVITHDRLYKTENPRDWKTLAEDGINNAYESEQTSLRALRGHLGAAKQGKAPGGPVLYGYRRAFNPETGKRAGQSIYETEAQQIRLLFDLLSRHIPVRSTAARLNEAEKAGINWTPLRVRRTALNPAYVALRAHRGQLYEASWEPIVDKKLFYGVQQILNAPGRRPSKPGQQKHLLSYLALCHVCGGYMAFARGEYRCNDGYHVSVHNGFLDEVVDWIVRSRLKEPDVLITLASTDDAEANRLEGELQSLKARLAEFRSKAVAGLVSIETLALAESTLAGQIQELKEKLRQNSVPDVLRDILADDDVEQIEARWNAATLNARRAVIRALCEIRVVKVPGMSGRPSDDVMRERAMKRLSASRWHGDSTTWGETWADAV